MLVAIQLKLAISLHEKAMASNGAAASTEESPPDVSAGHHREPERFLDVRGTRRANKRFVSKQIVRRVVGFFSILLSLTWLGMGVDLAVSYRTASDTS